METDPIDIIKNLCTRCFTCVSHFHWFNGQALMFDTLGVLRAPTI